MNIAGQFLRRTSLAESDFDDSGTITLLHIRNFLSRQWRLIAAVTALILVVAAVYLSVTPPKYTAQADMIIDTKKVTWTQSELATENRPIDDSLVESEIETTKSERVALAVARQLNLNKDPEFVGSGHSLKQRILSALKLTPKTQPQESEDAIMRQVAGVLRSNLRVTRLGRSYIEQIAYTSLDGEKAARIANAFADAYIEDQLQAKFEATRRASVWLEQRIGELRQQANNAYREVQDFKSKNNIIIGGDGKLASDVELDQLGVALAKARADTSQAQAKLDRISRVLEAKPAQENLDIPDPVVTDALNSPVITRLRQQFLDDKNKESEWSSRYGPDHQAAKNLRAEMAALQRAIWDEISRIAESYKSELQIAKDQESSIDRRMTEIFQQSSATRQSQVRLRELEAASNTYRGIYETFLSRFTQSIQQQSFPSTEARVVTPASPTNVPSAPKTSLVLALAAVCGLGLGIVLALGREQMNRKIYTRSQLEDLLKKDCLAVLPAFTPTKSSSGIFLKINEAAPFSETAEALRHIKVAIDLHPTSSKVIGMLSALPGEGKTTVSAGFAAFLAKSGSRTLLIDADLRNPSMTNMLGYAKKPGLRDIVAGRESFDAVVIKNTKHKFDFLPSSGRTKFSNSSDILNSPTVKQILKAASDKYDYVLVDLPPVLPVVDVKAIAHMFDAFVLVVEWGNTSSDEILKAVAVSPFLSERLLGSVLNKANPAIMRRFEGHAERRYHSYYSDHYIQE